MRVPGVQGSVLCENTTEVLQMLKAIWPSLARLPNHLPASANITTSGIMCYFLYWLIQVTLTHYSTP